MKQERWEEAEKRKAEERRSRCAQMFCGSGGLASRLPKAAGAEPSGQMRNEKLHAVVARSRFRSQMPKTPHMWRHFASWDVSKVQGAVKHISKWQNTSGTERFWKLRCWKSVRLGGATVRSTFGSWDVEKCMPFSAKHISKWKYTKRTTFGPLLDVQASFRVAGAMDSALLQNSAKRVGFVTISKTMAGAGRLKRICKHACRVARAVQETFPSDMFGQGADFLRRDAFWSIRSSAFIRWFCVTGATLHWPGITFSWQAQYFQEMEWKIAKRMATRLSAQHSNFHFWKRSRRIASLFSFQLPNFKKVPQNSFVFNLADR